MSEISTYKSAAGVLAQFRTQLDRYVLKSDEILDDNPSSWTSVFGLMIGELAGNTFFETQAYIKEVNESTAIKERSLLHKLSANSIAGIYGTPARLTFMLGYPEKDILSLATPTQYGDRRLRVGHNLKMWIDDYPRFTLDHNLDIVVTTSISGKLTISGEFDLTDLNGFSEIETPFVNVQNGVNINGTVYSVFHLPLRQYERTIIEYQLTNRGPDKSFSFNDNLMGFEVFYQPVGGTSWLKLVGAPDGNRMPDGYNYAIETRVIPQKVKLSFGTSPTTFDPLNGTIRIVVYTTKGDSGNFDLPNVQSSVDGLQIEMAQDNADLLQIGVSNMRPLISIRETKAFGGRNALTIEEIRQKVIDEKSSGSKVLSLAELLRKVTDLGLTPYKTKSDVFGLEFRVAGPVVDQNSVMIPTTMEDLRFTETDVPLVSETRSRLITPKHIFEYDTSGRMILQLSPIPYAAYAELYNNGQGKNFSFPYFIRIESTSQLDVKVFDLSHDAVYKTEFKYFNERSTDRMTVESIEMYRNPIKDSEFVLRMKITANDTILRLIEPLLAEDYPLAFRTEIQNVVGGERFAAVATITTIDTANGFLTCETRLKTNDSLTASGKLCITENSLTPIPFSGTPISFYFIEDTINVSVVGLLKGDVTIPTIYDDILTDFEKVAGWYVSTIFTVSNIPIFKNLSNIFRLSIDVQMTQPTYTKYDQIVYEKYEEDVFEMEDGAPKVIETQEPFPDGSTKTVKSYAILHKKGDLVLDNDNHPIVKYNIGDIKMTGTGVPEIATPPRKLFIIRSVPVYNRIYAASNMYGNISFAFQNIINKISSIENIVDGVSMRLGVKKTTGRGAYKFMNLKTKVIETLDDMALSLAISVRPKNVYSIADMDYFLKSIRDTIISKVLNNNSLVFSFMKMLEEVKSIVPNIDYFELRKVNNYEPGICQTITADEGSVSDQILGIRYVVDTSSSDISMDTVVLKPAIDIDILT